jgi:hypothetical protein
MSVVNGFARIDPEQSRKQAKELVKAHKAGDRRALDRIRWNHPRFRGQDDAQIATAHFALADAQLVIARQHHFTSWRHLLAHVRQESSDPAVARFEGAAVAIVTGDIETLRDLLSRHPELIHQRSRRAHRSTLLHYVSANGVEDVRQLTPPNILEIATLLLDVGAEAYGGGSTTLGLVSTSAHPRARGVQIALIDLLLARGARIDGEHALPKLVSAALANGCPEAAVALASRGAHVKTLYAAAGIGDLAWVRERFVGADPVERERAMLVAAQQGHLAIVTFLLDAGVDVHASDGMTAMHHASAGGHLALMEELLRRGARLEALNGYGGSVLSSTLWFAHHVHDADFVQRDYPRVVAWLVAAGARTDFYPELAAEIEAMHRRAARLASAPRHDGAALSAGATPGQDTPLT